MFILTFGGEFEGQDPFDNFIQGLLGMIAPPATPMIAEARCKFAGEMFLSSAEQRFPTPEENQGILLLHRDKEVRSSYFSSKRRGRRRR